MKQKFNIKKCERCRKKKCGAHHCFKVAIRNLIGREVPWIPNQPIKLLNCGLIREMQLVGDWWIDTDKKHLMQT